MQLEARPSSVCITCYGIGYEQIGSCTSRLQHCIICSDPHKIKAHYYGVPNCNKDKDKTYAHITVQCVNCGGGYSANSNQCTKKHKAKICAQKSQVLSKGKIRIVELNDKVNLDSDKTSSEPKAYLSLKASPAPKEVRPSLEKFTPNPDIKMNLVSKWAD